MVSVRRGRPVANLSGSRKAENGVVWTGVGDGVQY